MVRSGMPGAREEAVAAAGDQQSEPRAGRMPALRRRRPPGRHHPANGLCPLARYLAP